MSPARIAVLLTPIIAGLSGFICQWIAEHFPGAPQLDATELTAIMVAGILAAALVLKEWLTGRAKYEETQAFLDSPELGLPAEFDSTVPPPSEPPPLPSNG